MCLQFTLALQRRFWSVRLLFKKINTVLKCNMCTFRHTRFSNGHFKVWGQRVGRKTGVKGSEEDRVLKFWALHVKQSHDTLYMVSIISLRTCRLLSVRCS